MAYLAKGRKKKSLIWSVFSQPCEICFLRLLALWLVTKSGDYIYTFYPYQFRVQMHEGTHLPIWVCCKKQITQFFHFLYSYWQQMMPQNVQNCAVKQLAMLIVPLCSFEHFMTTAVINKSTDNGILYAICQTEGVRTVTKDVGQPCRGCKGQPRLKISKFITSHDTWS